MTAEREIVTDPTPRICIRYDDGSLDQLEDVPKFLERGIPVSLALNWGTLRDEGGRFGPVIGPTTRLTKQQIRHLQSVARDNGTELELCQHSNFNWSKFFDGSNHNFGSYTWDEIVPEVDPSEMEDYFGQKVKVYVQPGDPEPNDFVRSIRELVIEALREVGIDYAIGLEPRVQAEDFGDPDTFRGAPVHGYWNSQTLVDLGLNQPTLIQARPGFIPFCTAPDPYRIPGQWTADLSGLVITRGTRTAGAPGPDPKSGAPGWILGENNNGAGVEGNPKTDAEKEIRWLIYQALGFGQNIGIALHGMGRTDASDIALSTGTGPLPGHFSAQHLADLIARLAAAGHLIPTTASGLCRVAYADWAENVDVFGNPSMAVPQQDIDDLGDGVPEYAAPRGVCAILLNGRNEWSEHASIFADCEEGADYKFGPLDMRDVVGAAVAGPRGAPGGMILSANSDGNYTSAAMGRLDLPPGMYELSFIAHDYLPNQDILLDDTYAIGVRHCVQTTKYAADSSNSGKPQTIQTAYAVSSDKQEFIEVNDTLGLSVVRLPIHLPSDPDPVVTGRFVHSDQSVANGSSLVLGGGAQQINGHRRVSRNSRVSVRVNEPLASGVTVAAEITDIVASGGDELVEVTVTLYNESGSSFSFGTNPRVQVLIEEDPDDRLFDLRPISDWIWRFSTKVQANGGVPIRVSRPRLRLVRRY